MSNFKVGDKVMMTYAPQYFHDWVGIGTILEVPSTNHSIFIISIDKSKKQGGFKVGDFHLLETPSQKLIKEWMNLGYNEDLE